jgi:hypothetical protein
VAGRQIARTLVDEGNSGAAERPGGDWVARCEGFGVVSPEGRIGTVEEIRYGPSRRWDSPTELAIQAGRGGNLRLIVPVDDVAAIVPDDRLVLLRASPRIVSTERDG